MRYGTERHGYDVCWDGYGYRWCVWRGLRGNGGVADSELEALQAVEHWLEASHGG